MFVIDKNIPSHEDLTSDHASCIKQLFPNIKNYNKINFDYFESNNLNLFILK